MPRVRIVDGRVRVGAQSRALLSGEVHYWRLDPTTWPAVLDRCTELGLDVLGTYVCWDFHEVGPGQFDFIGQTDPRRNLLAFIELAAQRGFWLIVRPGPYIYAEWPNSGIPERMVSYHRLDPEFQREARIWMAAVTEAIRGKLATHAGPIALLQADNEADPWFDVYGSQLGLSDAPGLFQDFLRTRYGHIADLNADWATACTDFIDARAVMTPTLPSLVPRYLDVCRFRHWYATEVVRWTTDEYRRLGIDVPISANTYESTFVQDWGALARVCDLVGPDLYPTARMADDPEEHRRVLEAIRYARSCAPLAFIPEFEAGIWHGWHRRVGTLMAAHVELNALTVLMAGVHGWNWYMLADRDSWYMSPITELGRARPDLAPAFAEVVRLFRALDPSSLARVTDTAVTFNAFERAAGLDDAGLAVLRALYAADIDYEFFDLDSGRFAKPLLVYAGGALLSETQEQRLKTYVDDGGTLILFQPTLTADFVKVPERVTTAAAPQRVRVMLGGSGVEMSSAAVNLYSGGHAEPIWAERIAPLPPTQEGGHAHVRLPVGERLRVGYVASRGKGRVIVLGLDATPELLVAIHAWLGVRIACRATASQHVHSALFERGADRFVVVTNTADDARDVRLQLDVKPLPSRADDLRGGDACEIHAAWLSVRVPARAGTVVRVN